MAEVVKNRPYLGTQGAAARGLICAVFGRHRPGRPNLGGFWPSHPRVPLFGGFGRLGPGIPHARGRLTRGI